MFKVKADMGVLQVFRIEQGQPTFPVFALVRGGGTWYEGLTNCGSLVNAVFRKGEGEKQIVFLKQYRFKL